MARAANCRCAHNPVRVAFWCAPARGGWVKCDLYMDLDHGVDKRSLSIERGKSSRETPAPPGSASFVQPCVTPWSCAHLPPARPPPQGSTSITRAAAKMRPAAVAAFPLLLLSTQQARSPEPNAERPRVPRLRARVLRPRRAPARRLQRRNSRRLLPEARQREPLGHPPARRRLVALGRLQAAPRARRTSTPRPRTSTGTCSPPARSTTARSTATSLTASPSDADRARQPARRAAREPAGQRNVDTAVCEATGVRELR